MYAVSSTFYAYQPAVCAQWVQFRFSWFVGDIVRFLRCLVSPVALCFSLFFLCAFLSSLRAFEKWQHFCDMEISSATRSTNVVRARAHNSLRIHLNLHNNPKCSAMSFCRFNYYCLNNFALLAGARATVCCYYYHWSLFSLQIVGRLCVSVYIYGTRATWRLTWMASEDLWLRN